MAQRLPPSSTLAEEFWLSAANDPLGYAYVPEAAANAGGNPPATGFVETPAGLAAGLVAENGDADSQLLSNPRGLAVYLVPTR